MVKDELAQQISPSYDEAPWTPQIEEQNSISALRRMSEKFNNPITFLSRAVCTVCLGELKIERVMNSKCDQNYDPMTGHMFTLKMRKKIDAMHCNARSPNIAVQNARTSPWGPFTRLAQLAATSHFTVWTEKEE
ncbi:LOW QUALITY PROTEIN: hypothetical protein ACHAW5_003254 [Stephanodiscus triporus]|uniref:Uncharacterized protein n=1 Tax=Stephanodiscus triporus TaxID=2934178 RepID=A0ABD3NN24_9STRA